MRSKVAVIVALLFVLAVGAAALAVNTRILDTSPRPDIGRANEVLAPSSAPPGVAPVPVTGVPAVAPPVVPATPPTASPSRSDDDRSRDNHPESGEPDHDSDD